LVSRAYFLGAGLPTAGVNWAPSTRDMVPWDGVPLASWASYVSPKFARPGDLVLYDTGGAIYRHVVMLLADGYMLHTNSCGDVAHVNTFIGFGNSPGHVFLVARRVIAPGGIRIPDPVAIPTRAPSPTKVPVDPNAGDPKVLIPPPGSPVIPGLPSPSPATSTPTTSPTPSGGPGSPTTSPTTSPAPTTTSPAPTPTSPAPADTTSPTSTSGSPTAASSTTTAAVTTPPPG
jgi:hypothetical protein